MSGIYFEEFEIGRVSKHAITRTITETDNLIFCALTHNPQPLHLDAEFAKNTEFGQRIVNSIFTLGLMIGVSVGDTLRAETTVAEKRESRWRPDAGIVVFDHRCFNQRAEEVAYCKRSALMRKRPAS